MNMEKLQRPLTLADIEELRSTLTQAASRVRAAPPHVLRFGEEAANSYRLRRMRDACFGTFADLFSEPAWDVMLDLYAAAALGQKVSVTAATESACVPPTTALRRFLVMEQRGLLVRTQDPHDKRRFHMSLTDTALTLMNEWFEQASLG